MRLWGARALILNRNRMIRLSRQFLEADKAELDRISVENINSVQALVLSNVGRGGYAVSELNNPGNYLGSNVF